MINFVKEKLDNFLHRNPDTVKALEKRIKQSERERKKIAGIKKLANQRAKKANLHNKKLRDCRLHFSDSNGKPKRNGAKPPPSLSQRGTPQAVPSPKPGCTDTGSLQPPR